MAIEMPTRRGFVRGLGALFVAAPAIVRATSLMPVRAIDLEFGTGFEFSGILPDIHNLRAEFTAVTRRAYVPKSFVQLYRSSPILKLLAPQ